MIGDKQCDIWPLQVLKAVQTRFVEMYCCVLMIVLVKDEKVKVLLVEVSVRSKAFELCPMLSGYLSKVEEEKCAV